jgi:hypothetical protein
MTQKVTMRIERRRFLQQTGLAILTLGASQVTLPAFNPYVQTLAATTNRKLALLVGINQYSNYPQLNGCVNDVELQKELLIQRFNFEPQDILVITEKDATRENIETAFIEHLVKQAKATDIVVFHFSGYGSFVKITNNSKNQQPSLFPSLVPVDRSLLTKNGETINNLLTKTLVLLAQSLATDKVTLVLDTSYAIGTQSLQGNLKVRSLLPPTTQKESTSEVAFQEQIQLALPSAKRNIKPVLLHAAGENQLAVEQRWQNFSAGLFTYSLTQYLWETIPPSNLITCLSQTTAVIATIRGTQQQPQLVKPTTTSGLVYFAQPKQAIASIGYISSIQDNNIQVQLLGLSPLVLQHYGVNSCFTIPGLDSSTYLQLRSLNKLTAQTHWLGDNPSQTPEVGQLIQEYIRVLPKSLKLAVALDNSLERIERVDATSGLVNLNIALNVVNPGEQWADCLLGKNATDYSLFTPGGNLIYQTTGEVNEAVKSAVTRLNPYLEIVLAAKLARLTLNQSSSLLPVEANLTIFDQRQQKIWQKVSQSGNKSHNKITKNTPEFLPTIPVDSTLEYLLTNQGNNPVYFIFLSILPNNQAIAIYTPPVTETASVAINPGETKIIPNPDQSLTWKTSEPLGITEILVICSNAPFTRTTKSLTNQPQNLGNKETIQIIPKPLAVTQAILTDLHNASAVKPELIPTSADVYALAVTNWASFSFVINPS